MHVRHEPAPRYLMASREGGKLYGPYHHGERHYFQLMYRRRRFETTSSRCSTQSNGGTSTRLHTLDTRQLKERYQAFLGEPPAGHQQAFAPMNDALRQTQGPL